MIFKLGCAGDAELRAMININFWSLIDITKCAQPAVNSPAIQHLSCSAWYSTIFITNSIEVRPCRMLLSNINNSGFAREKP